MITKTITVNVTFQWNSGQFDQIMNLLTGADREAASKVTTELAASETSLSDAVRNNQPKT